MFLVFFILINFFNTFFFFFFSSRRRHTRFDCDWSSDVCSSDLRVVHEQAGRARKPAPSRGPGYQAMHSPMTFIPGSVTESQVGGSRLPAPCLTTSTVPWSVTASRSV